MDTLYIIGFVGALFVGVVLGLIGGGGSILTVPILVYLMGFNPIIATAYSLFIVGSSSLVGTFQKHRKKLVDFKTGLIFSFPSFIAVYLTRRYLVPNLPDTFFHVNDFTLTKEVAIMLFFAIIMLLSSISMIRKKKEIEGPHKNNPYYITFIQGLVIGTITGLIGAGGGFLYVPALVLWANLPMKKAVGTSLVIITLNSLIGFTGDIQNIDVDWRFLLSFSGLTIIGIIIGGYASKHVSNEGLKRGFGIFTLIMACYIMYMELT
ncbi:sulfite exporter TauE/SafE family protein [Gelidibacter salicanalis]|uniref:Probable membrane transporter protein n=1 Tax=Gelidibacter salicanalis TaxID=291193 RepID=A0A5C7AFH2_9FLAO|nr:sulfite exporter TauE/SafE family protein [Gelidibacter salicanalis]TXE07526.1 sulfite exporter TauE/SafE family protein [Gelidibacter salicanalis]